MKLNNVQLDRAQQIWQDYIANGEKFLNASKEYTQQELDQRRRETITEILGWLNRFLRNEVPLEEFKTVNDGINKRTRLWGFQGISGQMFFNVITKNSMAGEKLEEFVSILKRVLPVPTSIENAKDIIEQFSKFVRELGKYSKDSRGAPKVGSIPFFLSYFWQIQSPDEYPVYYSSMVNALREVDIWSPTGNVAEDYTAFYHLNHELRSILSETAKRELTLWDIEHAFWFHMQSQIQQQEEVVAPIVPTSNKSTKETFVDELPGSYIPPVVSILPRLAINDPALDEICHKSGKAIEKEFEERLAVLFGMLGFETELMGQGHGRVPDGVAVSDEFRYAIIYDAKVRQQAYTMGTDERAIREYIVGQGDRLRKRGIKNLYFMVISSAFTGDHDDAIRGMKIETNVNEVLLVEVKALLAMLEGMLRNPSISLGPDGIQRLLAFSGILTESDVRVFMEV
jgi:hypothetical protein